MIMDLATRALRGYLAWKARREYEAQLARERRHLLHDLREAFE